jgi:hypothetical protein
MQRLSRWMAPMEQNEAYDLRRVWKQNEIPVIVRKGKGHKLRVKLPNPSNDFDLIRRARAFLKSSRPRGHDPIWLPKYDGWELPQVWFSDLVNHILERFSQLYVIQPYREQEKCASKCMNAEGHECECSCMGSNHGAGGPSAGWFEVSDTFATRWGEAHLACRLMVKVQR